MSAVILDSEIYAFFPHNTDDKKYVIDFAYLPQIVKSSKNKLMGYFELLCTDFNKFWKMTGESRRK